MDAPDLSSVFRAVSANARTWQDSVRTSRRELLQRTYLWESGSFGYLLNTIHERAEINGGDCWVAYKLDEVVDDNDSPALDLHRPVVQGTDEEWDEDRQRRRGDLGYKRCR